MEILRFIFGLGIAFSIFGFLWAIIMFGVNLIRGNTKGKNREVQDYAFRIVKYFLLVSVTANFIFNYENGGGDASKVSIMNMVVGVLVLALYLFGKLQKRTLINQLANNPMISRFTATIDPKVERYLLSGSLVYFVFCLQFPGMVNNGIVNWFRDSIINIYDTPVIGWVFSIIGFFFLINIILRGARVIGSLITGQPINDPNAIPKGFGNFGNFKQGNSNPFEQFRQKQQTDDEFVDYEDVTDEEGDGKSLN